MNRCGGRLVGLLLAGAVGCATTSDLRVTAPSQSFVSSTGGVDSSLATTTMPIPATSPPEPVVIEGKGVRELGVDVGDCFTGGFITDRPDLVVVDCNGPHDGEVISFVDHPAPPGADYPGRAEVSYLADQYCAEEFARYVGESIQQSTLLVQVAEPLQERWEELDDRTILCGLMSSGSPLIGSQQGAGTGLPSGDDRTVNGLIPGDCFLLPEGQRIFTVSVVPCTQPHDREVFAVFDAPSGMYPGDEEVNTIATDRCLKEFAAYVGLAFEQSILDANWFAPDAQTWTLDDRRFICMLGREGQQLQDSQRGAGR